MSQEKASRGWAGQGTDVPPQPKARLVVGLELQGRGFRELLLPSSDPEAKILGCHAWQLMGHEGGTAAQDPLLNVAY